MTDPNPSTPKPSPFTRILVPLDGSPRSEEALPYALAVAGPRAALTVLHVVPDAEPLRKPLGQITKTADEVMAELTAEARAELDAAVGRLDTAAAGSVDTVVRFGDVADTILAVADEIDADAVVLASSGRGLIGRLALGSVADDVSRRGTRPTLVVREAERGNRPGAPTIERLVVPLDGSARGRAALPVAAALAGRLAVPIALISVVEPSASMGAASVGGVGFSAETYTGLDEEIEAITREGLAAAERELAGSGVPVATELARGSAAGAIVAFTSPTDLIVMTSRGHGGFARLVLGSVAGTLLREAPAPVLLVPVPVEPAS